MKYTLEICSFNLLSAIVAMEAGAQRIELCGSPGEGGTTPGPGLIRSVRELLPTDVYPIIRPRGGDFIYSDAEFRSMLKDVEFCKQVGCNGVVAGILLTDGTIDKRRMSQLVEAAYPLGVTFHRAFDWAANPFEALEDVISIGCERILTSGQRPTAMEGISLLNQLVRQADERIVIMPGSGVRSSNIAELAEKTEAVEFHSSARGLAASTMEYRNEAMREDLVYVRADREEIEAIVRTLATLS